MSAPRDADANGPRVILRNITREALKQFEALARTDQRQVAKAIAQPPLWSHCELVQGLKKHRVHHFRASETLRISFAQGPNDEACIGHIGTHAEFDQFAQRYDGCLFANAIPLEERSIMAPAQARPCPSPGDQKALGDQIREMSQLFESSMGEVIKASHAELHRRIEFEFVKPMHKSMEELQHKVAEIGRKAETDAAQLRGDAHKKDTELDGRIAHTEHTCRELWSDVQALKTDLEQKASTEALAQSRNELKEQIAHAEAKAHGDLEAGLARLASEQAADRQSSSQQWQAAAQRQADAEQRLQSVEEQLCRWLERVRSLEEEARQMTAQLTSVMGMANAEREAAAEWRRQWGEQLAGQVRAIDGLAEQMCAFDGALKDLRTCQQRMEHQITDLECRLSALSATLQRGLGYRVRAVLSRVHQWVWRRFGRTAPAGDASGMAGQS